MLPEILLYDFVTYIDLNVLKINVSFYTIGEIECVGRKLEWFNTISDCKFCIACASKDDHLDLVVYLHEYLMIPINIPSLYFSAMYGKLDIFKYLYSKSKHIFDDIIWKNCIEYSKGRIDKIKMKQLNELII
jgi:hypothetical protein